MQLELNDLLSVNPKTTKSRSVILSDRDLTILEFLLDMKFASLKDIFERFFAFTLTGEPARSNEWAIRRLQQLEKAKFVKSAHSFSERRRYYIATVKAYRAVSDRKPIDFVSKPLQTIDLKTFLHDKMVLESRIILENQRAATCWISDRKLRSSTELAGGLSKKYIPDGIYTEDNIKTAIEIEISVKSKVRYQDKIKKYVQHMRAADVKHKTFDRVLFVCAKDKVFEILKSETKIYGSLFEVNHFNDFFKKQLP